MKKGCTFAPGKMAEWSNAAVLKTVDLHGSGGSNPSLSAQSSRDTALLFFFIDTACNLQAFLYLMAHLCKRIYESDHQIQTTQSVVVSIKIEKRTANFMLGLPPRLIASRQWRLRSLVGDGFAVRIPLLLCARSPPARQGKGVKRSRLWSAE